MYDYENNIDWYDHDAVEKLRDSRSKKKLKIIMKMHKAKEKSDQQALDKARKEYYKHLKADEKYKQKAEETYFYWY